MSNLVTRLRDGGETCGTEQCKVRDARSGCICAMAADRIEELMKFQSLHANCDKASLDIEQKLVDQLASAHRRIEALEAALRSIAANTCCEKCQEASLVARAALEGEKKDG